MKRREFITLLGSAAATWPLTAHAQQPERMRRIAILTSPAENTPQGPAGVAAFREGLEKLGWTDGRNIRIETRWGVADANSIQRIATDLVQSAPDAIVVGSTPAARAFQQATRAVPIVFVAIADPVRTGVVLRWLRLRDDVDDFIRHRIDQKNLVFHFRVAVVRKLGNLLSQFGRKAVRLDAFRQCGADFRIEILGGLVNARA